MLLPSHELCSLIGRNVCSARGPVYEELGGEQEAGKGSAQTKISGDLQDRVWRIRVSNKVTFDVPTLLKGPQITSTASLFFYLPKVSCNTWAVDLLNKCLLNRIEI